MSQRAPSMDPETPARSLGRRNLLPSAIELTPPQVTISGAPGQQMPPQARSLGRAPAGKPAQQYVMTPFRTELVQSMPTPQSLDRVAHPTVFTPVNTISRTRQVPGGSRNGVAISDSLPAAPFTSAIQLAASQVGTLPGMPTSMSSGSVVRSNPEHDLDPESNLKVSEDDDSEGSMEPPIKRRRSQQSESTRKPSTSSFRAPASRGKASSTANRSTRAAPASRADSYAEYISRQKKAQGTQDRVWCAEVESAFMEAVWLMPRHNCKVTVDGRQRGRNELISDFIYSRTREQRTRKQVSSHIQVLKKVLKDDRDFMTLMNPPKCRNSVLAGSADIETEIEFSSFRDLVVRMIEEKQKEPLPTFVRQHAAVVGGLTPLVENVETIGRLLTPPPFNAAAGGRSSSVAAPVSLPRSLPTPPQSQPEPEAQSSVQSSMPLEPARNLSGQPLDDGVVKQEHIPSNEGRRLEREPRVLESIPELRHPRPVHSYNFPPTHGGGAPSVTRLPVPQPPGSAPPPPLPLSTMPTANISGFKHHHHHHHHPNHSRHRRTGSASIDLGSDKLLPVHFLMARRGVLSDDGARHVFSRLIRASYESPLRPRLLDTLRPRFPALQEHSSELDELRSDVQIVHATVRLHLEKPGSASLPRAMSLQGPGAGSGSDFLAETQFVVATPPGCSRDHTWRATTVISSRGSELLRGEETCMHTELLGRPYERISVPFRPDFWSEFVRLISSTTTSANDALVALKMSQFVHCCSPNKEDLVFVALYEFELAEDEFSGRTIFRRVRDSTTPNPSPHGTPSYSNVPNAASLGGMGTPAFASPRATEVGPLGLGVGASPMAPITGPEFSLLGDRIQRTMTAFEPAAWDELDEWIFDS